jgi:hypothetical protein
MAEYKEGGHGFEFFKLAEEFGYGDAETLRKGGFAKEMRKQCTEFWNRNSIAENRSYYLLGSKYGELANISMLESMIENSVVAVGFYKGNLKEYYLQPQDNIKQFLIKKGEEQKSYNALKKFLQLKPGDIVAVKKSGTPKAGVASLIIDAYAIVVSREGIVYSYDPDQLGHCINVEFIDINLNRELSMGGYNSTIAKIKDTETISQMFNGNLSKDEAIIKSKIRKRKASQSKATGPQARNGSKPYVANSRHNEIQKIFYEHLVGIHGELNVKMEEDWVDIKVDLGTSVIFYEVKPYHQVADCIREGLGQVLLYGFYSEDKRPKKLVIVGPFAASYEEQELVDYLKTNSSFNFEYEAFPI